MPESTRPDTISVLTQVKEEVDADSADLEVTIQGSSVFSGEEAFKKAVEVREIVEMLVEVGVSETSIKLKRVQIDRSTFSILKSSTATYGIKIAKVTLELLPDVLAVLAGAKNCQMNWLEWRFDKAQNRLAEMETECLSNALSIAKRNAATLGVTLMGIFRLSVSTNDGKDGPAREFIAMDDAIAFGTRSKSRKASVDLGFALGNSTEFKVTVNGEFRVSGFAGS